MNPGDDALDMAFAAEKEDGSLRIAPRKRPTIARGRFQLAGALVLAVAAPLAFRLALQPGIATSPGVIASILGATIAILLGFLFWRRIDSYVNAQAGGYVFWTFGMVFLFVMAVFLLLRLDYNRYIFFSAMFLSIGWFALVQLWIRRNLRPCFAVIPGGSIDRLSGLPGADFLVLERPVIENGSISAAIADLRHDHPLQWDSFIADLTLAGLPVYHYKQVEEDLTGKVSIEHLSENTFGTVLPDLNYLKIKQLLDIGLALVLLPILLPIMALAGLAILLFDGRPILFRQQRVGYRGKVFPAYKLRTMIPQAETAPQEEHSGVTQENDPRITPIGRHLRKYRIDELPQIINILRGEMSWIGPRPEAIELSKLYDGQISFYRYRHAVRPGITGWAQVSQGHVTSVDAVSDKLKYDFYYIKHVSIWLDFLIALKTVRTVLLGLGAK